MSTYSSVATYGELRGTADTNGSTRLTGIRVISVARSRCLKHLSRRTTDQGDVHLNEKALFLCGFFQNTKSGALVPEPTPEWSVSMGGISVRNFEPNGAS
jgi:hypothetical protein